EALARRARLLLLLLRLHVHGRCRERATPGCHIGGPGRRRRLGDEQSFDVSLQGLAGGQGHFDFAAVIRKTGEWNQDSVDAHELRASCETAGPAISSVPSSAGPNGRALATPTKQHRNGVSGSWRTTEYAALGALRRCMAIRRCWRLRRLLR